jgi:cytochrome c-type protein NapB
MYDGAPPVIPHPPFGSACASCHNLEGVEVEGVGFAPPSPHAGTPGLSALSRCQQCHVFASDVPDFDETRFVGLRQDLGRGVRDYPGAPPTIPHGVFMREHCVACHAGPAAREEIRTSHPERARCRQCHVAVVASGIFSPGSEPPPVQRVPARGAGAERPGPSADRPR